MQTPNDPDFHRQELEKLAMTALVGAVHMSQSPVAVAAHMRDAIDALINPKKVEAE